MSTTDFIEVLRQDVKRELREEIMKELTPLIEQKLYGNVFDISEASKYLKVSTQTIRRLIVSKEIPWFKQGGQLFFRQIDIDICISKKVASNSG